MYLYETYKNCLISLYKSALKNLLRHPKGSYKLITTLLDNSHKDIVLYI